MQRTAQISPGTMESISTPERVETHLGTLEFPLGVPTEETANRLYDHVGHVRAVSAFLDAYSGVSLWAARRGFLEAGIQDNDVLLFSEFMDPKTLVLTGNADTVYFSLPRPDRGPRGGGSAAPGPLFSQRHVVPLGR
ncbi:hypothetical protein ACFYUG_16205 [Streptomyces albogriseolus]|uniref:hypothetical protein n=1 Tax=Streptomyces albogriseolus TaxID=1887 RepID=UPI00367AC6FE